MTGRPGTWLAPGRVNIIGEHTDYNGGYSLPIALPHAVSCTLHPRDDQAVRVASQQHDNGWVSTTLTELADTEISGWPRYLLGVVHEFQQRGHRLTGMDLVLDGQVPVGAGLSSSAAVECSVAIALRDTFAPSLSTADLVDITHAAENNYVGAPTGFLDQSASLMCTQGHALLLDAQSRESIQIPFPLRTNGLALLVVDTRTPHRHATGEYATRRQQCEEAAAQLGVQTLREVSDPASAASLTDPILARRARHVVSENLRVLETVTALQNGANPRVIGPILLRGHESLRDDFEVSTPQLDKAVEAAMDAGAYGARMTGGGFGGSIIVLAEDSKSAQITAAIRKRFCDQSWSTPNSFTVYPADGARRVQ